ncbi:hypothetical protein BDQ17DRAFT_1431731 [Cyathus striatus]|nr:hypothetical protein BDQ17DRAFT_1431731 [Cyathus striatus]
MALQVAIEAYLVLLFETSLFQYLTHVPFFVSLSSQLISTRTERSDNIRGFIEKLVPQLRTLRLRWQDDMLLFTLLSCTVSPNKSGITRTGL